MLTLKPPFKMSDRHHHSKQENFFLHLSCDCNESKPLGVAMFAFILKGSFGFMCLWFGGLIKQGQRWMFYINYKQCDRGCP